jgi:hypothetical protein
MSSGFAMQSSLCYRGFALQSSKEDGDEQDRAQSRFG